MGAVNWLVDNMHVGTPMRDVIRDLFGRMLRCRKERGMPLIPKVERKRLYRGAIKRHNANRQLCVDFRL